MSQLSLAADPEEEEKDYGTRLQGAESALAHLLRKGSQRGEGQDEEVEEDVPSARESVGGLSQVSSLSQGSYGGGSAAAAAGGGGGASQRRSLDLVDVAFTQQEVRRSIDLVIHG
jgi:hypothetical protein